MSGKGFVYIVLIAPSSSMIICLSKFPQAIRTGIEWRTQRGRNRMSKISWFQLVSRLQDFASKCRRISVCVQRLEDCSCDMHGQSRTCMQCHFYFALSSWGLFWSAFVHHRCIPSILSWHTSSFGQTFLNIIKDILYRIFQQPSAHS